MNLTIAPLAAGGKVADDALTLLWGGLGTGYIEAQEFRAYQQGRGNGVALGAFATDELVGVLLGRLLALEEASAFETLARQAGSPAVLALPTVGILQSFVVKHTHRGQGVGTELCQEAIRHLRQSGATCLLALSWESGAGKSSRGLLDRLGLKVVARLEEFWRDDSLARGYHCPRCGNPCRCAALLHVR